MAECYLRNNNKSDSSEDEESNRRRIEGVNAKFSPGIPPLIPFLPLIARESGPYKTRIPEVESPLEHLAMCTYNCNVDCQSWQFSYLSKYPDYTPPPTSVTAISDKDAPKPEVTLSKWLLTRKDLENEIAKQKLLGFYKGKLDIKHLRELFCKNVEPKTPPPPPPPRKEEKPLAEEQKKVEKPKKKRKIEHPRKDPEPNEKSKEKPESPKMSGGTNITDPHHPILKNRSSSLESPRVSKPYILPVVNTGDIDFFPGKPRLTQRYKADEMSRAARKIPIVEEADNRFALKASS